MELRLMKSINLEDSERLLNNCVEIYKMLNPLIKSLCTRQ